MSKTLGQPVVVENRPGNAGAVGADVVAKSLPDGYTLCLCTVGSLVTAPLLNPTVPYRTLRDLAPVSMVNTVELGLFARGSLSASNLPEFVALAKASPGKYTYATTGVDGPNYLAFQLFLQRAGINMLHVPYKGDGQSVVALAAGEVDIFVGGLQSALPLMKAGRVKAIAVSGKTRLAALPDTPTFEEAGLKDFDASGWQGVLVPAGTPPAAIAKLNDALVRTLALPEVREKFATQGLDAASGTPAEFGAFIRAENEKWGRVAKTANIKLD